MATARRYPKPLKFRDGGRVPIVEEPAAADVPAPASDDADEASMLSVVEKQRHAETMARRQMTLDDAIDALPDLTDHKRNFLKSNPELLSAEHADTAHRAFRAGLDVGMEEDSPDLDRFIISTVRNEASQRAQRLADAARASMRAETPPPVERTSAIPTRSLPPLPPPPQRRPSMPISAPPSRDSASFSGAPITNGTLSAAEREIARNSFSDPSMSNRQKELAYLEQREKLARLRREGRYPLSGQS